jgi:hypothetical protein
MVTGMPAEIIAGPNASVYPPMPMVMPMRGPTARSDIDAV